ncbi:MAG: DUF2231 domain-containing protein [Nitrospiraceae bacterium]
MHPIHPMIVHFPIALLAVSTAIEAAAVLWKKEQLRETSFLLLALGIAAAGAAAITGHFAEEAAEAQKIPEAAIELHESFAIAAAAIFAVVLGLRFAMRRGMMTDMPGLTLAGAIVGSAVLAVAGYFGGDLVYSLGAGVLGRMGGG